MQRPDVHLPFFSNQAIVSSPSLYDISIYLLLRVARKPTIIAHGLLGVNLVPRKHFFCIWGYLLMEPGFNMSQVQIHVLYFV
jgi:hypothetical protein